MIAPVDAVIVAAASCAITSMVWYGSRRRRLRRLLRSAFVHPDPDRRLSALYLAGLDGLRHHLDLVVDCALTESADVVLSSLVDLVMNEEWEHDRDSLVVAVRAWAEEFVAEQSQARASCLRPSERPGATRSHGCPSNTIDVLELAAYSVLPDQPDRRASRRSTIRAWVRSGAVPEIDALDVVDALTRQNGRARSRSAAGAKSLAAITASAGDCDPLFDDIIAEAVSSTRPGQSTATPLRSTARARSGAVGPVTARGTREDASAAAGG